MLTDEQLFDFDADRLAQFDPAKARQQLAEQREAFRAQLVAARWIEGWLQRMDGDRFAGDNEEFQDGFTTALREVAGNLRQGDLIPGGVLHDETDDGRLGPA
jgi:hypothetical protein